MPAQTQGAVTDVTAETLAVEEVALSAQSLHHIYPLGAEVADITAAKPRREGLTHHTLRGTRPGHVREMFDVDFCFFYKNRCSFPRDA